MYNVAWTPSAKSKSADVWLESKNGKLVWLWLMNEITSISELMRIQKHNWSLYMYMHDKGMISKY